MTLINVRLGDWIREYKQACGSPSLSADEVSGIGRDKEFFEPSRQVGKDTGSYKIVPIGFFACNLMHVGRDAVLPIALNHSGVQKIVSPAYTVFEIVDDAPLLPEYFFMMLKSPERDRYFWMHTDASIRDGMAWQDFCDLEFFLPDVGIQQRYVDIFQGLRRVHRSSLTSLEDLRLAYELQLDRAKRSSTWRPVGSILRNVDVRNSNLAVGSVKGINVSKTLMDTKANVSAAQTSSYKVVRTNQFAYSAMQTGRDKCIRIALHTEDEPVVVSPAYSVLETIDPLAVTPQYVMMWFGRAETDRYGWFASDASIRASLDLERFFEIEIPVPADDVQRAVVALYDAYIERQEIVNKAKNLMNKICPVLIKGSLDGAHCLEVTA